MSIYKAHRRRKTYNALEALVLSEQNVFNERLKNSSLHAGSRRSADSEFPVVGPATVKDQRPSELSW